MFLTFYVAGAVALASTAMVITRRNPIHALLYFILSLIAVAVIFLDMGAPFVAVLEVIIYAGAIMVLFIFVIMLLSPGAASLFKPADWAGPALLSLLLTAGLIFSVVRSHAATGSITETTPKEVGLSLFGPYLIGVELASLLLLAGLVGAYHLGRRSGKESAGHVATGLPVGGTSETIPPVAEAQVVSERTGGAV